MLEISPCFIYFQIFHVFLCSSFYLSFSFCFFSSSYFSSPFISPLLFHHPVFLYPFLLPIPPFSYLYLISPLPHFLSLYLISLTLGSRYKIKTSLSLILAISRSVFMYLLCIQPFINIFPSLPNLNQTPSIQWILFSFLNIVFTVSIISITNSIFTRRQIHIL